MENHSFFEFIGENLQQVLSYTGFANVTTGHLIMIAVGLFFIYLAIYEDGSVLNYLYFGVLKGVYPPLIFLGIGAMTDFSALISNPKLMLIGAAAQLGIFGAYITALALGFTAAEAGAIGIIGGADGPTAIFLSSKLAPDLMGAIAIAAYSYMALVPVIQPPIMKLLTTKKERVIRMKPPRQVSQREKILFPIIGMLLTCFLVPSGLPLLGMLFFGNLLKRVRSQGTSGRRPDDRHRNDSDRSDRRRLDPGDHLPDLEIARYLRSGCRLVRGGHLRRRTLRQILQPLPQRG